MLNYYLTHILKASLVFTLLSIALSLTGSVIAFIQRGGGGFREYVRYLLPLDLITRRSCYQDVGFILLKQLTKPLTAAPLLLLTSASVATVIYSSLVMVFGNQNQRAMPIVLLAAILIMAVLIQDFFRFYSHYVLHHLTFLWDIHKVHHSADFLTPLTNHRVHIIEEIIEQAVTGLSVGPFLAVAAYLTATPVSANTLLGFDAYNLIDALSFSVLRHSHIGLSYGRLERYFMSPKQHHLHHSLDRRHWDKNFGFLFACWDRMFKTICYSDPKEQIKFGILADEYQDYDTVLKLHFMPYLKLLRRRRARPAVAAERLDESACDLIAEPVPKT